MRVKICKTDITRSWLKLKGIDVHDRTIHRKYIPQFNDKLKLFVRQLFEAGILTVDDLLVMAAHDKAIFNLCVEMGVISDA